MIETVIVICLFIVFGVMATNAIMEMMRKSKDKKRESMGYAVVDASNIEGGPSPAPSGSPSPHLSKIPYFNNTLKYIILACALALVVVCTVSLIFELVEERTFDILMTTMISLFIIGGILDHYSEPKELREQRQIHEWDYYGLY